MASSFELALIAGDTAYQPLNAVTPPPGWSVVLRSNDPSFRAIGQGAGTIGELADASDYQGILLKNDQTGEYVLANRGTVMSFGNLVSSDGKIALTKLGLSLESAYESAAKAFAQFAYAKEIEQAAAKGNVAALYEVGHSLGFAGAQQQYTVLKDLANQAGIPNQAVGINGAGVAQSNFSEGQFGPNIINYVVPGDRVDDAGKQLGIKIELNGAGNGTGTYVLGGLVGVALSTNPYTALLGLFAGGFIGGVGGNHSSANAIGFLSGISCAGCA